jgi:hypothetical protein
MPRSGAHTTVKDNVVHRTYEQTHKEVANKTLEFLVSYAQARGLDEQQVVDQYDAFERALLTWIPSRHLTSVKFEVYHPDEPEDGQAVERFDLQFDIRDPSDLSPEERRTVENQDFEDNIDAVMRRVNELGPLPDDVRYRIIFGKAKENDRGHQPSDVPGFSSTQSRSVDHLDTETINEPLVHTGNATIEGVLHR